MKSRSYKIFRDNIHGYIRIPEDYVELFIDTELFQRLRSIEQTGMRILYPSARHDRFVHSLGVYYLGSRAFRRFRDNASSVFGGKYYKVNNNEKETEEFWDWCLVLFEIACLLHDCGHSPFSHTLEFIYDLETVDSNELALKDKLEAYFGESTFAEDFRDASLNANEPVGAPHERMSALLACAEYGDAIKKVLNRYELDKRSLQEAHEFIARMIIGCKYRTGTEEDAIKNCAIQLLNSSSIDVDSLDYIVRDAAMSGIDNMSIDLERLLNSITLVEMTEFTNCQFNNTMLMGDIVEGTLLPGNTRQSFEYDGTISGAVEVSGQYKVKLKAPSLFDFYGMITNCDGNAVILDSADFKKSVFGNGMSLGDSLPRANGTYNFKGIVEGDYSFEGSSFRLGSASSINVNLSGDKLIVRNAYIGGSLTGQFSGKMLGNHKGVWREAVVTCQLGFHKSSLSVIQNVITARNYEYQWIYSHHKVVYYANYLLRELLGKSLAFLRNDMSREGFDEAAKVLCWKTMIPSSMGGAVYKVADSLFWRPTDADMTTLFYKVSLLAKEYLEDGKVHPDEEAVKELIGLHKQFISRKYRKSLWKSYAEMKIFFGRFDQTQIDYIFKLFEKNSKENVHGNPYYGHFNERWSEQFHKYGLDDVIWVNGDAKLKTLEPSQTYIHFKDMDMTFSSASSSGKIWSLQSFRMVYIYYTPAGDKIKKNGLISFFEKEIEEYVKTRQEKRTEKK